MFGIHWPKPQAEREASAEQTRVARGTLADKVIELENSKRHLEMLMKNMLIERSKDAR